MVANHHKCQPKNILERKEKKRKTFNNKKTKPYIPELSSLTN